MLQDRASAALVNALHIGAARGEDTYQIAAVAEIIEHIIGIKALLVHAETRFHGGAFLFRYAQQKGRFYRCHHAYTPPIFV